MWFGGSEGSRDSEDSVPSLDASGSTVSTPDSMLTAAPEDTDVSAHEINTEPVAVSRNILSARAGASILPTIPEMGSLEAPAGDDLPALSAMGNEQ